MPNTIIREIDKTSPGTETTQQHAVFIPGFSSKQGVTPGTVKLCRTIAELESEFGDQPYIFLANQAVSYDNQSDVFTGFKKNSPDISYLMAKELISRGLYVYYDAVVVPPAAAEATNFVSDFIEALPDEFEKLKDTEEFDIQYATTGGYPAFEFKTEADILKKLVTIVSTRGDCVLLVDAINDAGRSISTKTTIYQSFKTYVEGNIIQITDNNRHEDGWTYAPLFYPGGKYNLINAYKDSDQGVISQAIMPASFSYLVNFANALINYPEWYAIAGAARGKLTGTGFISSVVDVPYMTANSWQPKDAVAINPICRVNPYGKLIWGNRTGCDNSANNSSGGDHGSEGGLIATSFLNVRVLSNMVKRLARKAANALMFEPNSDVLWINFKAQLIPILDQMLSGEGLRRYELVREDTTEKATLKCKIILYPIEAVEFFDITVELADIGSATTSVTIV